MGQLLGHPFGLVPEKVWQKVLEHLPIPPMVTGKLSRVDLPGKVMGRIITVPLTPTQLLTLPRTQVQARISAAIDLARDLGASIVGLGALTAPASVGGKAFLKRQDVAVTNGNSFTAAMTLQAIEKLAASAAPILLSPLSVRREVSVAASRASMPANIPADSFWWPATKSAFKPLHQKYAAPVLK